MTDRELTVLRAIQHLSPKGGPVLISQVIKALGLPKATTKGALIDLLQKGAVILHRHDWPQSLKPAERKNMILLAGNYYVAVSVKKSNPQTKGKKALKKAGRAIKRGAGALLGAGAEILGAGASALNPHGMSDKAWKAEENKWRKSIAAYRVKGWSYQQIKDRLWLKFGLTLDKLDDEYATFVPILGRGGGFTLDLISPLERRRMASKAKKGNPKRRRNADVCPTCFKPADQPYRRYDARGHVTEGCIDDFHTGHLITPSSSSFWHNRPQAKKWRAKMKKEKAALLKGGPRRRRNPDRIWQVYGYNKTAKAAAQEFARTYWAEPRKIAGYKPDGTFKVVRGLRTYRVISDGDLWVVEVVDDPILQGRSNPRRRNLGHKDSDHPVEVTHHYRAGPPGYMTPWQRAHHAGQKQLFETGIKPAKRRNTRTAHGRQVIGAARKLAAKGHTKAQIVAKLKRSYSGMTGRELQSLAGNIIAESKRNPTRKGMRKGYGQARALQKHDPHRKPMLRKAAQWGKQVMVKVRKGRANPSAKQIREKFAGSAGPGRDLYFPKGTPPGQLAKLGRLVSITTESGTIKPVAGSAWLCADTRGKLHLGSTSGAPLFDGPARNFGHVSKIEYEEKKPHLGYGRNPIIWFHHVGEETGQRPTLRADGAGGLVFRGGAYRLTARGIEN